MLNKWCNKFTDWICESQEDDKNIIVYGMELLLSTVFCLICTGLFAYWIKMFNEFLVFFIFFAGLRIWAGGIHAPNHIICVLSYMAICYICLTIIKNIPHIYEDIFLITSLLFSGIVVYKYAPVGCENRPLTQNEKIIFKKRSRTTILFVIVICILDMTGNALMGFGIVAAVAVTAESCMLLPVFNNIEKRRGNV